MKRTTIKMHTNANQFKLWLQIRYCVCARILYYLFKIKRTNREMNIKIEYDKTGRQEHKMKRQKKELFTHASQ